LTAKLIHHSVIIYTMRNILSVSAKIFFPLLVVFILTIGLQWINTTLIESGYIVVAFSLNFSFSVLFVFPVKWFNKKYNQLNADDYGFGFSGFFKNLTTGILIVVLIIGAVLLLAALFGVSYVFIGLQKDAGIALLEMIASAWVVGVWEEMYFRGLLFNTLLKAKSGFHLAAFITTLLFTVLHAGSYDMEETSSLWFVVVILLSYILLYLYIATRSIWAAVAFHFSWDFIWDLLNDTENKTGPIHVKEYSGNAILLDNISIIVLGLFLLVLVYTDRKRGWVKSYCLRVVV
jgi:membrane protease YdiL (CAAX protease family)